MSSDRSHNSFVYPASENQIAEQSQVNIGQPKERSSLDAVRHWITQNDHEAGSRLPPERTLAATLNLSRPELRKALAVLENEGRINRYVGRGTFVINPPSTLISMTDLIDRTGPHDAMMARIALEPELAQLAALHATPQQISRAIALATEIRGAPTWDEYERLDHALHDLIAQSAGNVLLHELHKIMNAVRQVVVWRQLSLGVQGPPPDYHSFDEHDAIVTAIAKRDRAGAKSAMRTHLKSTINAMTAEV
jgi:DNA-binding FadR family transcriptional regulator